MFTASLAFVDDGWTLIEREPRAEDAARTDTLFTTSNGYLGIRANLGGVDPPMTVGGSGTFLNGFFESRPYAHAERSFGLPETYQTMIEVTDATAVDVAIDGAPCVVAGDGDVAERERRLDLRTGCVTDTLVWRSPGGRTVRIRTRRLVSLRVGALAWIEVTVDALDGEALVELTSAVRANTSDRTYPGEPEALARAWGQVLRPMGRLRDGGPGSETVGLVHATRCSQQSVACVAATSVSAGGDRVEVVPSEEEDGGDLVAVSYRACARPGRPVRLLKRIGYADGRTDSADEVLRAAAAVVDGDGATGGLASALEAQARVLQPFWDAADVKIEGAPDVEAAIRFGAFQAFQASACNDGRGSPAKGLTGHGYQGHHMWDQELYVGHALAYLAPEQVRAALRFRCRTLDAARQQASTLSHRGAQFPWRTIDGREASGFFPAGAAQYHINADIAWAVEHLAACAGDDVLLSDGGVDLLVESARLWLDIGHYDSDGRFRIAGVTGADEYTAIVDDNLFTNAMAAEHLRVAADRVEWLAEADADAFAAVVNRTGLSGAEAGAWRAAADAVYLPYDERLRVHPQDDTFLSRPRWDLAATPPDRFPLQDHHHLLDLYRHQVLKQPDVVLTMFLLGHRFSAADRRRNFDYYEPLTTHDSSLSPPVHAIVAADVGYPDRAWDYLRRTAMTDLGDLRGTLTQGIHLAAAAGSWLALACGFGGVRVVDGSLRFAPQPIPGVGRFRFRLRFRGRLIDVAVDDAGARYTLLEGPPLEIRHHDDAILLEPR